MSTANISQDDPALFSGWVDFGDGVHATRSPEIIQQTLLMIRKQHIFCTVVAKGYESGKIALVEFGSGRMVLDRPVDWPPRMALQPLRILFKDKAQLWNQLAVKLLEVGADSLVTSMPLKYVRLQRRNNYRVGVPSGSRVVFQQKDEIRDTFYVENVSANGCLVYTDDCGETLPVGALLSDITMSFPTDDDVGAKVQIKEGRVVRTCLNDRRESCFGIQFMIKPREERDLLHYVRLREREMLRRGMAD